MKKVREASLECAKYFPKRETIAKVQNRPERDSGRLRKGHEYTSFPKKDEKGQVPDREVRGKNDHKKKVWSLPCLNPECGENHRIRGCIKTTKEKAKELLKVNYDKKKRNKGIKSVRRHDPSDRRIFATIKEVLDCAILGDSGADESAISKSMVDKIVQRGRHAEVTPLRNPIQLSPAIKLPQSVPMSASERVHLTVKIYLPCEPLRLRRVGFLMVDQEMEKVLLGRPLMKSLGFDWQSHLETVRDEFDDKAVSLLGNPGGKHHHSPGPKSARSRPKKTLFHKWRLRDPIPGNVAPDKYGAP